MGGRVGEARAVGFAGVGGERKSKSNHCRLSYRVWACATEGIHAYSIIRGLSSLSGDPTEMKASFPY